MPLHRVGAASRSAKVETAHGRVEEVYTTTLSGNLQLKHFARLLLLNVYFWGSCCMLAVTQYVGIPLYIINRDYYYRYMAWTKRGILLLVVSIAQCFSTTKIYESGDRSVSGQIKLVDGMVEHHFPSRLVMIANHQLYNDWVYLWYTAYTNEPPINGNIFIILKDSIKYIPVVGLGLRLAGFVFMSRKMKKDQPRLSRRLTQLRRHISVGFDPMWLMIFPEGTNLSRNGRLKSALWAETKGHQDLRHQLLPRSAGTYFCLKALEGTLEWVYDCTLAYDGIPKGQYGQDIFTMWSMYIEGKSPPIHIYWRRFKLSTIPLATLEEFDTWLLDRWREKEALLEEHLTTGRFPSSRDGYVRSQASLGRRWALWRICGVSFALVLAVGSLLRFAI